MIGFYSSKLKSKVYFTTNCSFETPWRDIFRFSIVKNDFCYRSMNVQNCKYIYSSIRCNLATPNNTYADNAKFWEALHSYLVNCVQMLVKSRGKGYGQCCHLVGVKYPLVMVGHCVKKFHIEFHVCGTVKTLRPLAYFLRMFKFHLKGIRYLWYFYILSLDLLYNFLYL